MFSTLPRCLFLSSFLGAFTLLPGAAQALEYGLQVLNVTEEAFAYYMDPSARGENGSWTRLESAADKGEVSGGSVLADRSLRIAEPALVRAFEAVLIKPEAARGESRSWSEVRWQGEPGKRAVWVVEAGGFSPLHEVRYVGLRGNGAPGFSVPLNAPIVVRRFRTVAFPTQFLLSGQRSLWEKWVSRYLDLAGGVGAVVGVDTNPTVPDKVFLVIEHPSAPALFKVALAWRKRASAHVPQYEGQGDSRSP